jgi:hypothetical protein
VDKSESEKLQGKSVIGRPPCHTHTPCFYEFYNQAITLYIGRKSLGTSRREKGKKDPF